MAVGVIMIMIMIVSVVVFMAVEGQGPLRASAKNGPIFISLRDNLGVAFAADVAVEADHPV